MLQSGDVVLIVVTIGVAVFVAATWKSGAWPWKRAGLSFQQWLHQRTLPWKRAGLSWRQWLSHQKGKEK